MMEWASGRMLLALPFCGAQLPNVAWEGVWEREKRRGFQTLSMALKSRGLLRVLDE